MGWLGRTHLAISHMWPAGSFYATVRDRESATASGLRRRCRGHRTFGTASRRCAHIHGRVAVIPFAGGARAKLCRTVAGGSVVRPGSRVWIQWIGAKPYVQRNLPTGSTPALRRRCSGCPDTPTRLTGGPQCLAHRFPRVTFDCLKARWLDACWHRRFRPESPTLRRTAPPSRSDVVPMDGGRAGDADLHCGTARPSRGRAAYSLACQPGGGHHHRY